MCLRNVLKYVNGTSWSWHSNACDRITYKYFSLVSTLVDNVWQMLRHSCTQKCYIPVWKWFCCGAASIRGLRRRKIAFLRSRNICGSEGQFKRHPLVLEAGHFKRIATLSPTKWGLALHCAFNQHRFDWKYKQNLLTKIALSTAYKRTKLHLNQPATLTDWSVWCWLRLMIVH